MLDTTTKRRIDTARDILVGKVPDPKSQVEQITIALIYKFMDDMDAEGEELGGKRKFFANDYERYGWAKLMRSGLGGHETLNLYAEAIAKMPENPGIPALFRDIFKNAYLPYRDPETLKSFLKIIDEFEYDHSERLGDAFEYLLSVLGSQGDAGQFRTPRHIIDFMVEIIAPKKNEVVLDPACGTAGFLISAYKHILKSNVDANGTSTLTPDDRKKMAENFKGYDISPDMVRLSLVNLYLHGFTNPSVFEYDTLTSEDRWKETADVILANPPFMSPKGGIKPHQRFSIQAKRSEVLFLDYIAEHLNANGRAAIIVPEGIIFQSQTAYVQLRKLLVENSLVAVVSLPAGMFNPYSGVKTSILILDKALAKQSTTIGFFKIENDGYSLGAQRREGGKDDLPQVKAELETYLNALRARQSGEDLNVGFGLIVPKEELRTNGEFNLSGERYRAGIAKIDRYPFVRIGECCVSSSGGTPDREKPEYYTDGTIPWLRSGEVGQGEILRSELFITELGLKNSSAKMFRPSTVLVAMYGATAGEVGILRFAATTNQAVCGLNPDERLIPEFLYLLLKSNKQYLIRLAGGGAQPNISQKIIRELEIPLPPLDVQREIVAEIEGYQKIINGARAVLENYRPHISIKPEWPMAELGEICDVRDGTHDSPKYVSEGYPLITSKNLKNGFIDFTDANLISRDDLDAINKRSNVDLGDLLMPMIGTIGNPVIATKSREYAVKNVALIKFPAGCQMDNRFLKDLLDSAEMYQRFNQQASGSTQRFIPLGFIRKLRVPLPPMEIQQAIVAEIEAEQALVAANRKLITRFEAKIQATLARVWDEAEPQAAEA